MKAITLGIVLLATSAFAKDSVSFDPATVVAGGGFTINGQTHVKNTSMYLCLAELPQNVCYLVTTDDNGNFTLASSADNCNFSLHEDYVGGDHPSTTIVCDTDPKTVMFMIVRPGTSHPILATGDYTLE